MTGVSWESAADQGLPDQAFFEWFKIQASGPSDHRRERIDGVCLFWLGSWRATAAQAQGRGQEGPNMKIMHACICVCAFVCVCWFLFIQDSFQDPMGLTSQKIDGWMMHSRFSIHSNRCHSHRGKSQHESQKKKKIEISQIGVTAIASVT